jgi:2-keto-4-pentenoate hydratase
MAFNPLKFALWFALSGISFGLSLSAGWLVLAGVFSAIAFLAACVVWYFLSSRH